MQHPEFRRAVTLMIALLGLAFLVLGATAEAAQAGPWGDHARRVARDTFSTPLCGEPQMIRRDPATYAGGHQAEWLRHATAWADPERCAIVLNARKRIRTAWRYCHVVAHEWGHLAGYEHSDDPTSLMYEGEPGMEGKVRANGRSRWIADGYYGPCKPAKVTRRGEHVTGSFTS